MSKGKFASGQDEALYQIATDGDEWVGSDDFGLSAALVALGAGEAAYFGVSGGIYVVSESADGFVTVDSYDTMTDAECALQDVREAYDKFLQDEADDPWIPETAPGYQEA
jgi:hypothetical protein